MEYTREQIKAAYALNLCTVSVSQIIDYADLNIMEQEYETILNNLNLEQMPKDEALLTILKQILDTITEFRIQDKERRAVEDDYQKDMKNAIWSAIPRFGLDILNGSALNASVSLVAAIGIRYMNYRNAKVNGLWDAECWQMKEETLEKFHALRRELFDTAWRLSSEYGFPDQLRLTERQIHQYNSILMDSDLIRKFERLETISKYFAAYPPFWYQLGSTANAIARSELDFEKETRNYYRECAVKHLLHYRECNQHGLLREDPISSACALELFDYLDIEKDRIFAEQLLNEALAFSGDQNDIIQMAVIDYFKLKRFDDAEKYLRQLVNEQFNTDLNAQLLSCIYVSEYINNHSETAKTQYKLLTGRVGASLLYQMPEHGRENREEIEKRFVQQQRKVLEMKYTLVLRKFIVKYSILFGKLIPEPETKGNYPDSYYMNTLQALENRKADMLQVFNLGRRTNAYLLRLQEAEFPFEILRLLNEMFDRLCELDVMSEEVQDLLAEYIENAVLEEKNMLMGLQEKMRENKFSISDMNKLLDLDFGVFTKAFFNAFHEEMRKYIESRTELQDFALSEQNLSAFCKRNDLPDPAVLYGKEGNAQEQEKTLRLKRFGNGLLLGDKKSYVQNTTSVRRMLVEIEERIPDIILSTEEIDFFTSQNAKLERYFNSYPWLRKNASLKAQTIAVLDDKKIKGDNDLIFTVYGIVPVKNGYIKQTIPYEAISWTPDRKNVIEMDTTFSHPALNICQLFRLIQELREYAKPLPKDFMYMGSTKKFSI